MSRRRILILLLCFFPGVVLQATNYYINSTDGNDSRKGTAPMNAWKTALPLSHIQLKPGDSVLFASGQVFSGMLSLVNVKGEMNKPVVISSYRVDNNSKKPILDAAADQHALLIQNSSFIQVSGLELTAIIPYTAANASADNMRCGIVVEVNNEQEYSDITLSDLSVHDVQFHEPGHKTLASETATANGTQAYGWGVRFMNKSKKGVLKNVKVRGLIIFNVSHTGLKFTAPTAGIQHVEVSGCSISQTGGPGMQLSGVTDAHIYQNTIRYSGSTADSRNWGRGSGLWTWGCSNILIENNRFEHANGPGDSAGVHIDYNCNDVVVQYNVSANNAGGFCEILGNNYNCAYRYNISINDGYRIKGKNGAFQEGKIFWLSGYQGDKKPKAGPYNSYFYNNSIYVSDTIVPRIAVSSSSHGVLIANNLFYFERKAEYVAGDQKKNEIDSTHFSNVVFTNNLFLHADSWPSELSMTDPFPIVADPGFKKKGGFLAEDYIPANSKAVVNKGVVIRPIPNDSIGLRIGLQVAHDILGNKIIGVPDLGAIELKSSQ